MNESLCPCRNSDGWLATIDHGTAVCSEPLSLLHFQEGASALDFSPWLDPARNSKLQTAWKVHQMALLVVASDGSCTDLPGSEKKGTESPGFRSFYVPRCGLPYGRISHMAGCCRHKSSPGSGIEVAMTSCCFSECLALSDMRSEQLYHTQPCPLFLKLQLWSRFATTSRVVSDVKTCTWHCKWLHCNSTSFRPCSVWRNLFSSVDLSSWQDGCWGKCRECHVRIQEPLVLGVIVFFLRDFGHGLFQIAIFRTVKFP